MTKKEARQERDRINKDPLSYAEIYQPYPDRPLYWDIKEMRLRDLEYIYED